MPPPTCYIADWENDYWEFAERERGDVIWRTYQLLLEQAIRCRDAPLPLGSAYLLLSVSIRSPSIG
jgi:hypothetical protein